MIESAINNERVKAAKTLWLIVREPSDQFYSDKLLNAPFLRPSSATYKEVISGKNIILEGQCFQYDSSRTPSQIILEESINGLIIDFELFIDSEYHNRKLIDLHTGKVIYDTLKKRKNKSNNVEKK